MNAKHGTLYLYTHSIISYPVKVARQTLYGKTETAGIFTNITPFDLNTCIVQTNNCARTTPVKMTHKYKTTGNALYNTYNMLRELE